MPELPEVEVVRAGLARHVTGASVTGVEVLHPRPLRRDPRSSDGFVADLIGRRIEDVRRRGKYFWLALRPGDALLGHLGMSGQMLLQHPGAADEKHLRVRFVLGVEGTVPIEMRFVDQRMFGGLLVSDGGADLPEEIEHIGRDPLDPEFDDDDVVRRMRRRTVGMKRLPPGPEPHLRHRQHLRRRGPVAGPAPRRPAGRPAAPSSRSTRSSARPARHVRGARQGGTSFDSLYVNVNGESGYFDRSLHAYGREGEPCDRCGRPIRRIVLHEPFVVLLPEVPAGPQSTSRTGLVQTVSRLKATPC